MKEHGEGCREVADALHRSNDMMRNSENLLCVQNDVLSTIALDAEIELVEELGVVELGVCRRRVWGRHPSRQWC